MIRDKFSALMCRFRSNMLAKMQPGESLDELASVIKSARAIKGDDHRRMMTRLLDFGDTRVRELMVPRSEMKSVSFSFSLSQIADAFVETGLSRLPVIDGNLDQVRGIIYAKDVFIAEREKRDVKLSELLRPCLTVPESQIVLRLLSLMKDRGTQIAIVRDEYSGTSGLITLSDLLTEIVGPIDDADDEEETDEVVRVSDRSFIVQAKTHIEDLEEVIGIDLPDGGFDTVGGWVLDIAGRIPGRGEKFETPEVNIQVLDAEPRRIQLLRIELRTQSPITDA